MTSMMARNRPLVQEPAPGTRMVKFCGETVVFTLNLPYPQKGTAWVRSNIGRAEIIRRENIRAVEQDETPLGRTWFDIPMKRTDERRFTVTLPLFECGHFEAKCYFLKEQETTPVWPPGPNTVFNVDAADACCANVIYNAFVRQFGPNKSGAAVLSPSDAERVRILDKAGYTVIPPSGTFRDLIQELDFIVGELGCRIILLLPIHPTPTTYGRMGRFGSPYAALSFTAVDPALAVFDPQATPLEQFIELVDAVHQRNAQLFIDIAINHTGWAAGVHETHPEWLVRGPQGRIEVPGAWGVSWEDLTKLDYSHRDLWRYIADVFLTWCHRGVDGFRCDAGYMIPIPAWKYMLAKVREQFPRTKFLLEGLGGKTSITRELLNTANLNWAYSELFQNYDRRQIEGYLPEAIEISNSDGIMVHFAETHDNPRLASHSPAYARMRTALCALASHHGAFGFANGVEWFATEKIDVHDSHSLNWGSATNQVAHIRRLNHLLKAHPLFHGDTELKMIQQQGGNHVVLLRQHRASGKKLLVLINLDAEKRTLACWNPALADVANLDFFDLLSESKITVADSEGLHTLWLDPGQVFCLTQDAGDLKLLQSHGSDPFRLPRQIEIQQLRAKAFEVFSYYHGTRDLDDSDPDDFARRLEKDPISFCKALNPFSRETRVIPWQWPEDLRREVMIPPGHFLLVIADRAFRASLVSDQKTMTCEESLPKKDGTYFALFIPRKAPRHARRYILKLTIFATEHQRHVEAPVLALPQPQSVQVKGMLRRPELLQKQFVFLHTNGRGGMLRIPVAWATLNSRYDSLLAANVSNTYPEDRWIMFTRCRAWVVFQGYSQELNSNCLESFALKHCQGGFWRYHVPTGQGQHILLTLGAKMLDGENTVQLFFYRHPVGEGRSRLDDAKAVQLILRPDIESRSFHQTTKAYTGPEHQFPQSVRSAQREFVFQPDPSHCLHMQISDGVFVREPEWYYMVHRAVEAERGEDPNSDLFSPGYFVVSLIGGKQALLRAEISDTAANFPADRNSLIRPAVDPLEIEADVRGAPLDILKQSLDAYIVRRGKLKSVIAGYPWFLDWGRDALIFVRGLIAAGKTSAARAILKQFGQFERDGTLPNMIRGNDAGNRDTSDAPLWFILACQELVRAEKSADFLDDDCNGRSVRRIILSIADALMTGTPNGVCLDSNSGLIFSPAHFTWMDTNYPAGTPRQGYPVEIQALWYAALRFLATVAAADRQHWRQRSERVQHSLLNLFWRSDLGYLSDCLHASPGQSAAAAIPDDALRPNQLLAITLGAVTDKRICRRILAACEELIVPGAIRSLADRPVRHAIPVVHRGSLLNDPNHPYQGTYSGDEDTRRKPAYHNGTAWTWLFPSFCEAWVLTYGDEGRDAALARLISGVYLLERGCLGHIPEILDGDYPHTPRGCDAQAWGTSELLRVMIRLCST
jgi:starch synthase (maltosyl-transferring)